MRNTGNLGNEFPTICIVGAGVSGMCAAVQLKRKLPLVNFTVYESNSEVGGNWLVNTYPGCACDIQSHLYSYSFASKADWTKEFASQPEILEYIKSVARRFDIYQHIEFNTQVEQLIWIEKLNKWRVITLNKESNIESENLYDIVINGSGELRLPEIPDEFKSFKGPIVHSAKWDPNIELDGKKVAVIGSGATAIQLIPGIVDKVSKLLAYQRQPAWVIPNLPRTFSKTSKFAFAHVPGLRAAYRSSLFLSSESIFPAFQTGTAMSKIAHPIAVTLGKYHMNRQIKESLDLKAKLIPNYRFGCKRVGISNKYYPALQLPHVEVITSKIEKVIGNSITTQDGRSEEIDVLILATGFRVHEYFAPMEIIGKHAQSILPKWKKNGPSAYLGITSSDMPNNFILLGPGSNTNHNSAIFQIECQVRLIINIVREMMKRKASFVAVKRPVELEYMEKTRKAMLKTVFGKHKCGSWFTDPRGVVTTLYPKSSISYWRRTKNVDFDNFDFL